MKKHFHRHEESPAEASFFFVIFGALALVSLAGLLAYQSSRLKAVSASLEKSEKSLAAEKSITKKLSLEKKDLETRLGEASTTNSSLTKTLTEEKTRNDKFESEIQAIGGTVGTLKKLSETDKELLQKYSKVYFLNEHYVPDDLAPIPKYFQSDKLKTLLFHGKAYPYLIRLMDAASSTDPLLVVSAYRSYGEQASLKTNYKITYGSGANTFSADQGYSEHQLGTTVDFTTPKLGSAFSSFGKSSAFEWLSANAYRYGFILSYPKNNSYYIYEPWHWRFVGINLATLLHDGGRSFYDVPQREIDQYLISIF